MSKGASVITLNKGRDAHLRRLLEGLSRGMPPDACIVVEMGAEPAPLPDFGFPVERIVMDSAGLPLARARNAGRRAARSPHLVFLDVDCIPSADLVASLSHDLTSADGLVCCEVNSDPPNPASDAFHAALGFRETGRQAIHGGAKTVRYLERALPGP